MYKVEYFYRNNTSGNVRCKQSSQKSATATAATNESTDDCPWRDLTVRERGTLLFELQKYVHDFISLHLDRQQYQQNAMPQQPQQNQPLMFAQEQNQHQQPESFMGMLHHM